LSRLLSVLHQLNGTTIDGASYTMDAAGNRTSKTDQRANVTTNYGYDAIYQLLSATGGSTPESYTYDAVGNRLTSAAVASYNYNSSNELTSTSNGSYTYDANGNTLTDASGRTYTWDFENRLAQVVMPGGSTVQFKYDPFGRRIYKSSSSAATIYAYDGNSVTETVDQSDNVLRRFAQSGNIDEPLAELQSGTSNFYEADGLGSITSMSSTLGTLSQAGDFFFQFHKCALQ
ncbi:MAG TPA: hypothetical protein VGR36_04730, partial [Candidatus Acidoferrales bacterium]|nr:hypothetical protein [Candidatus Acidoferrales bacterium]